ncbi:BamA/TamA family outer membrane protein [Rufibacter roseus]|uniref:BamA/TamA family outer membrane protein n=1 Tax=Rufibacter roseus TaxID=1567108 RepID=A0ABW2DT58_9BACT|nr:BamA/TamA family outer membrane protein [Rufibacter roseus]
MKKLLLGLALLATASGVCAQDAPLPADDTLRVRSVKWSIFPIAYYTPETRFGFGAKPVQVRRSAGSLRSDRPSTISPSLVFTTRKQMLSTFLVDFWRKHNAQHIHGWVEYNNYPYVFFGVGNDTPAEAEENYTSKTINLYAQFEQRLARNFYLGMRYDLKREWITEVEEGGFLQSNVVLGSEGITSSGLGPVFLYDNRDNLFTPGKGVFMQMLAQSYNKLLGGSSNFMRYRIDLRKYHTVGPGVLAGQSLFTFASGEVPFQFMSPLGGVNQMRGFLEGRFRDHNAAVLQADYRFPLFWRISGAVFGATGQVTRKNSDFSFNRFKNSGGGGLRYRLNDEGMVVRGDVAYSKEGMYVYFAFGEAF